MQPRAVLLVLYACLAAGAADVATAQDDAARARQSLRRAGEDAQAACRRLLLTPHAFAGSVHIHPRRDEDAAVEEDKEPSATFRGARRDGLQLLLVEDASILTHGERQLVRRKDAAWTLPLGDLPDCPLDPVTVARHLPAATIDQWATTSYRDRPALRVHARWTGKAAAELVAETSVTDLRVQATLERFPMLTERIGQERLCVDAVLYVDPAQKALYATTLRVALLDTDELPPEAERPPARDGLPVLQRLRVLEFVWTLTVLPAADVPMPALDAAACERLRLPTK